MGSQIFSSGAFPSACSRCSTCGQQVAKELLEEDHERFSECSYRGTNGRCACTARGEDIFDRIMVTSQAHFQVQFFFF